MPPPSMARIRISGSDANAHGPRNTWFHGWSARCTGITVTRMVHGVQGSTRGRRTRRRLGAAVLAAVAVAVAVVALSPAAVPVPSPLVKVRTTVGGVERSTTLVAQVPTPVDADGDGRSDLLVTVGVIDLSRFPRVIVPNITIARAPDAVLLRRPAPRLRVDVDIDIRDLANGLDRLALVSYGYAVPEGGAAPTRHTAALTGDLASLADPLKAEVDTPGYDGPLTLNLAADTPALDGDFGLRFDPLPPDLDVTHDPRSDGMEVVVAQHGPVRDVALDAEADLELHDPADDPEDHRHLIVDAGLERVPASSTLDLTTAGDRVDADLTLIRAPGVAAPDLIAHVVERDPGPDGALRTDATLRLSGLPDKVETAVELPEAPGGGERTLRLFDLQIPAGEIGSVDVAATNVEGGLPGAQRQVLPEQGAVVTTRPLDDGARQGFDGRVRLQGVRAFTLDRRPPEGHPEGADPPVTVTARVGDGTRPMRVLADLDDRGLQPEPPEPKHLVLDTTVRPLPARFSATITPKNTAAQGTVHYEAAVPVDVRADVRIAEATGESCGEPAVTCATADVRRVPEVLDVTLPDDARPGFSLVRGAGSVAQGTDVVVDLDRTTDGVDDEGEPEPVERSVVRADLRRIPPIVRGRIETRDDLLRAAESTPATSTSPPARAPVRRTTSTACASASPTSRARRAWVPSPRPRSATSCCAGAARASPWTAGSTPCAASPSTSARRTCPRTPRRAPSRRPGRWAWWSTRAAAIRSTSSWTTSSPSMTRPTTPRSRSAPPDQARRGAAALAATALRGLPAPEMPEDQRASDDPLLQRCDVEDALGVDGRTPLAVDYGSPEPVDLTASVRLDGPDLKTRDAEGGPIRSRLELASTVTDLPKSLHLDVAPPPKAAGRHARGPAGARVPLDGPGGGDRRRRRGHPSCGRPLSRPPARTRGRVPGGEADGPAGQADGHGRVRPRRQRRRGPPHRPGRLAGEPRGPAPGGDLGEDRLPARGGRGCARGPAAPCAGRVAQRPPRGSAGGRRARAPGSPVRRLRGWHGALRRSRPRRLHGAQPAGSRPAPARGRGLAARPRRGCPARPRAARQRQRHDVRRLRFSKLDDEGKPGFGTRIEGAFGPDSGPGPFAAGDPRGTRLRLDRLSGTSSETVDGLLRNAHGGVDVCLRAPLPAGVEPAGEDAVFCDRAPADRLAVQAVRGSVDPDAPAPDVVLNELTMRRGQSTFLTGAASVLGVGERVDVLARTAGASPDVLVEGRDRDSGDLAEAARRVTFALRTTPDELPARHPIPPLPPLVSDPLGTVTPPGQDARNDATGDYDDGSRNFVDVGAGEKGVSAAGSIPGIRRLRLNDDRCDPDDPRFPDTAAFGDPALAPRYTCVEADVAAGQPLGVAVRSLDADRRLLAFERGHVSRMPDGGLRATLSSEPASLATAPRCAGDAPTIPCRPPLLGVQAPRDGGQPPRLEGLLRLGDDDLLDDLARFTPRDRLSRRLDYERAPQIYARDGVRLKLGQQAGRVAVQLGMRLPLLREIAFLAPTTYSCARSDENQPCGSGPAEQEANAGREASDIGVGLETTDGEGENAASPLGRMAVLVHDFTETRTTIVTGAVDRRDDQGRPLTPEATFGGGLEGAGALDEDLGFELPRRLDVGVFIRNDYEAPPAELDGDGNPKPPRPGEDQHHFVQIDGRTSSPLSLVARMDDGGEPGGIEPTNARGDLIAPIALGALRLPAVAPDTPAGEPSFRVRAELHFPPFFDPDDRSASCAGESFFTRIFFCSKIFADLRYLEAIIDATPRPDAPPARRIDAVANLNAGAPRLETAGFSAVQGGDPAPVDVRAATRVRLAGNLYVPIVFPALFANINSDIAVGLSSPLDALSRPRAPERMLLDLDVNNAFIKPTNGATRLDVHDARVRVLSTLGVSFGQSDIRAIDCRTRAERLNFAIAEDAREFSLVPKFDPVISLLVGPLTRAFLTRSQKKCRDDAPSVLTDGRPAPRIDEGPEHPVPGTGLAPDLDGGTPPDDPAVADRTISTDTVLCGALRARDFTIDEGVKVRVGGPGETADDGTACDGTLSVEAREIVVRGTIDASETMTDPDLGTAAAPGSGAGHAARGGRRGRTVGEPPEAGQAYGENSLLPGSPGSPGDAGGPEVVPGAGGGAVALAAERTLRLSGRVDVHGGEGSGVTGNSCLGVIAAGGGSGGAIALRAGQMISESDTVLDLRGGDGGDATGGAGGGGGSGGVLVSRSTVGEPGADGFGIPRPGARLLSGGTGGSSTPVGGEEGCNGGGVGGSELDPDIGDAGFTATVRPSGTLPRFVTSPSATTIGSVAEELLPRIFGGEDPQHGVWICTRFVVPSRARTRRGCSRRRFRVTRTRRCASAS